MPIRKAFLVDSTPCGRRKYDIKMKVRGGAWSISHNTSCQGALLLTEIRSDHYLDSVSSGDKNKTETGEMKLLTYCEQQVGGRLPIYN